MNIKFSEWFSAYGYIPRVLFPDSLPSGRWHPVQVGRRRGPGMRVLGAKPDNIEWVDLSGTERGMCVIEYWSYESTIEPCTTPNPNTCPFCPREIYIPSWLPESHHARIQEIYDKGWEVLPDGEAMKPGVSRGWWIQGSDSEPISFYAGGPGWLVCSWEADSYHAGTHDGESRLLGFRKRVK